jgi:hypothetical protein
METANVTVQSISEKTTKSGKPYRVFTDHTGKTHSIFDNKVGLIVGGEYAMTFGINEKGYEDIKSLEFITSHPVDEHVFTEEKKNSSIVEQVAVKEIGELIRSNIDISEELKDKYFERLRVYLGMDAIVKEKTIKGVSPVQTTPEYIAFLNRCAKELKLSRTQVEMIIGSSVEEVTDFEGAFVFVRDSRK